MAIDLDPSVVSDHIAMLQTRAAVGNALLTGTKGMRDAGTTYLPQEPMEDNDAYAARLSKTVLFPAYEKALNTMVGRPFDDEITLEDDVPQAIKTACENINRAGCDLDIFASDVFSQTLNDGTGWLVVDCTNANRIAASMGQEKLNLAQERAFGVGPYLIHVPLSNALEDFEEVENGVKVRKRFRYKECVEVVDGQFSTKRIERVRVLEPGLVTVYEQDDKGKWQVVADQSGAVSLTSCVPVVCIKLGRKGWSPLENLAHLNVEHWQSKSDQRNILHMARVPLLFGKDLDQGTDGKTVIGPNRLIRGTGHDTDLKWVELQGLSIESGRQDLIDIEDAMRRTAGELLSTDVQKTATETRRESGEGESQLKKWVHCFEDCLEMAFQLMAEWIGEKTGGGICINTEWDDNDLQADMMTALTNLRTTGNMSLDSMLWNLKQGGKLPPDRTVEQEKALIQNEAPPMGGTGDPMLSAQDRLKARADATGKANMEGAA